MNTWNCRNPRQLKSNEKGLAKYRYYQFEGGLRCDGWPPLEFWSDHRTNNIIDGHFTVIQPLSFLDIGIPALILSLVIFKLVIAPTLRHPRHSE
jgi:hypothetical protein